ncbi:winged helix-turn-helix transcriptional regulator [bacterium]|nr:winged helix-turn-helix transcriptional regulator [bacterium]
MNTSYLKNLGLTEKEIKIYLNLLENGILSVRGLAQVSELNRGSVYDILKNLQQKGLVSYFHKDTKQKFIAENPEKILNILREKEEQFKRSKKAIGDLIPQLKSLQEKSGNQPTTKFYDGKKGIKMILEDLLDVMENLKEKEYYVYSAKDVSEDINDAFPNFTNNRIKKNIKVKVISLAKGGKMSGLDERRWLGTNDETATFIIIYKGKCAFISRDNFSNPVGVIIENDMIYETEKTIFLNFWDKLNIK